MTREPWEDLEEEKWKKDSAMVDMSLNVHMPSCGEVELQE